MEIRLMSIEDYDKVYQLWTNARGVGMRSLDDSYDGIKKFLERNPSTNYIAEVEDKIVGVILCGHDGRRGYIYHTAVSPDYRRNLIGSTLVHAALKALKKEKINKAALVVFGTNEVGNEFWESMGFEKRDDLVYRNISINENNV